jgi:GT2 family glycosyltransferase
MPAPLVYVIVINWNGIAHVRDCFDTVLCSGYPRFRVVLVDNASTDGSPEEVERRYGGDGRVEVLRLPQNRNWGGGNNAGIGRALEAGADYVFLLNNDTWLSEDALSLLVEAAEAQPRAGAIAPKMVMFDTPEVLNSVGVAVSSIGAAWDNGAGRVDRGQFDTPREVAAVCGGAMFLRAEALRKVGGIDEAYGIYYDDVDLCLRLWAAGYSCVTAPGARVGHKFSASTGGDGEQRKIATMERNRLRCLRRHFGASPAMLAAAAVGELRVAGSAIRDGQWWRLPVQARAWGAFLSAQRLAGAGARVEALLERGRMFCPAVLLPRAGVYPLREWGGIAGNPCAPRAAITLPEEAVQLCVMNTAMQKVYDCPLAALPERAQAGPVSIRRDGSLLYFESTELLLAEESGLAHDTAGFVQCRDAHGAVLDLHAAAPAHRLPAALRAVRA